MHFLRDWRVAHLPVVGAAPSANGSRWSTSPVGTWPNQRSGCQSARSGAGDCYSASRARSPSASHRVTGIQAIRPFSARFRPAGPRGPSCARSVPVTDCPRGSASSHHTANVADSSGGLAPH